MNLLVICCDTFRYDIIGAGKKLSFVETPNLDALAERSVVFDHAYGECQATIQMRLGFWTGWRTFPYRDNPGNRGLMSHSYGWHRIPDTRMTISEMLFERGYVTGFVSDVFHMFKPNMNFHRGFMNWLFVRGQEADPLRCGPIDAVDIRPYVPDDEADSPLHSGIRQYLIGIQDRRTEMDWFTPQVFTQAMRFLEDNHRRPPWFLWVDSFAPHEYWDPPRWFADKYHADPGAKDYILPQIAQTVATGPRRSASEIERTKALYYGYVTFVDKWIGALLNKLDDMKLWDETIVMFVTDHGTELMENNIFSKNIHGPRKYNHQINWLVRTPGDAHAGRHVQDFVLSHDIPATMLDLLGVEPAEPIEGRSAWPMACGGEKLYPDDTVVCGWTTRACVRDREWAYIIETTQPDAQPLLFHTAEDEYETKDVAADHPDLCRDRLRRLEEYLGQSLPATYVNQPDTRNLMTLRRHLDIRRELGIPTGLAGEQPAS